MNEWSLDGRWSWWFSCILMRAKKITFNVKINNHVLFSPRNRTRVTNLVIWRNYFYVILACRDLCIKLLGNGVSFEFYFELMQLNTILEFEIKHSNFNGFHIQNLKFWIQIWNFELIFEILKFKIRILKFKRILKIWNQEFKI
jgi:hypothetical protein